MESNNFNYKTLFFYKTPFKREQFMLLSGQNGTAKLINEL